MLFEFISVKKLKICIEENDFKSTIILEKSPKQIGLIPGKPLINPLLMIFKRIADIMKVYKNSWFYPWQDIEYYSIHITSDL